MTSDRKSNRGLLALALMVLLLGTARYAHAEWTKDIQCPTGTEYRDLRPYAGRGEFCERLLPGSLRVKHGPYKFWYNADLLGDRGNYTNGRRTGPWRECDRFGRCKHADYPLIDPQEEHPGLNPQIPITFQHGKYRFDFASCWSTWVTQSGSEDTDFNIGDYGHRCTVNYFPANASTSGTDLDRLINCSIPFSVGPRVIPSLDLMHEFPKLGLPQFCRPQSTKAGALFVIDKHFRDIAFDVDVQCASIERGAAGQEAFVFRLNSYVTDLLQEVASSDGPLITRMCFFATGLNEDQPTEILHEPTGATLLRYRLESSPAAARKQKKCITQAFSLKATCR
jgi:hypothetical protein